jgi:hypothetical protein
VSTPNERAATLRATDGTQSEAILGADIISLRKIEMKLLVQVGEETIAVDADLSRPLSEIRLEKLQGHAVCLQGAEGSGLFPVPVLRNSTN